jgi:hypothetical protein
LGIYEPKYNPQNETHQKLATLGKTCHEKAATSIKNELDITNYSVRWVQMAIIKELEEIDKLVKKLIG